MKTLDIIRAELYTSTYTVSEICVQAFTECVDNTINTKIELEIIEHVTGFLDNHIVKGDYASASARELLLDLEDICYRYYGPYIKHLIASKE